MYACKLTEEGIKQLMENGMSLNDLPHYTSQKLWFPVDLDTELDKMIGKLPQSRFWTDIEVAEYLGFHRVALKNKIRPAMHRLAPLFFKRKQRKDKLMTPSKNKGKEEEMNYLSPKRARQARILGMMMFGAGRSEAARHEKCSYATVSKAIKEAASLSVSVNNTARFIAHAGANWSLGDVASLLVAYQVLQHEEGNTWQIGEYGQREPMDEKDKARMGEIENLEKMLTSSYGNMQFHDSLLTYGKKYDRLKKIKGVYYGWKTWNDMGVIEIGLYAHKNTVDLQEHRIG